MNELLKAFGLALSITEIEITLSQSQIFVPAQSTYQSGLYAAPWGISQSFEKVIWKYTTQFGEQYKRYNNTPIFNQYNNGLQAQYQQSLAQQQAAQASIYNNYNQQLAGQSLVHNTTIQANQHQYNNMYPIMAKYSGIVSLPVAGPILVDSDPYYDEYFTESETRVKRFKNWALKTFRIFKRSL